MTAGLNPKKVAALLTQSSLQLDDATLAALAKARHNALNRQSARSPVLSLATGRWTHGLIPHSAQYWVVAGLLVAVVVIGTSFWQHSQEQQISDLDVAILTDDLPIEIFVD